MGFVSLEVTAFVPLYWQLARLVDRSLIGALSVVSLKTLKEMKKSVIYLKFNRFLGSLITIIFLLGCTRTCVGVPELGSKQRPIRFYLDGWARTESGTEPFARFSQCIEAQSGFRVSIEIAGDEKAVSAALGRGDAQFGLMSSLGFVEASVSQPLEAEAVLAEKGVPSTRAVLIGNTNRWQESLKAIGIQLTLTGLKSEEALSPLNTNRIVYLKPESDVGFYVPRQMLFQKGIFPEEAIFAGTYPLVVQALQRDLGLAGVLSESFVEDTWPHSMPVQLGSRLGDFTVLAVSQGLPGKVLVARVGLATQMREGLRKGMDYCSKIGAPAEFQQIFQADSLFQAHPRIFDFIRELHDFQQENLRVLSQQQP